MNRVGDDLPPRLPGRPQLTFPARVPRPMAITNVAVVPMDQNRVLPDQIVVIDDGSIKTIGPSAGVSTAGMLTVDGTDRYLLPGLADMHVHYWMPGESALFLANGVTLVRNMAGAPFHLELQRQIQQGKLPGPHIVTTSPIVDRWDPGLRTWVAADERSAARRLTGQLAGRGYQQIKVLNSLSLETVQAICEEASLAGLRVTGHCPDGATFEQAIDAGMSSFEHLTGIWRGRLGEVIEPLGLHNLALEMLEAVAMGVDEDAIRHLAHDMAARDVWNCPTLVALRNMYDPQEEGIGSTRLRPIARHVPSAAMRTWAQLDPSGRLPSASAYRRWRNAMSRRNDVLQRIVSILHEEGAPLLVGTDTSVRLVVQGFSLHEELASFVEAGMTPYEALRCATTEAARFLGQSDEWGTVAEGKRADLILTRSNPLMAIGSLQDLEGVFVNGFHFTRADLNGLLDQQSALDTPADSSEREVSSPVRPASPTNRGAWSEREGDCEVGRVEFSHRRLPSGEWLIEECRVFEQGSIFDFGGVQRHSVELSLKPDLTIREATVREESWVGESHSALTLSDSGAYRLSRLDEDGHEVEEGLGSQPLLPDPTLGLSIVPLLADYAQEQDSGGVGLACRLRLGRAEIVALRVGEPEALAGPGACEGYLRRIVVERGDDTTEWVYTFSGDGRVSRVTCGSRTFVPVSDIPHGDLGEA